MFDKLNFQGGRSASSEKTEVFPGLNFGRLYSSFGSLGHGFEATFANFSQR
jgi:hypothetical protein